METVYLSDKDIPVGSLEEDNRITLLVVIQFENNGPRIIKVNGKDVDFPLKHDTNTKSDKVSEIEPPGITFENVAHEPVSPPKSEQKKTLKPFAKLPTIFKNKKPEFTGVGPK